MKREDLLSKISDPSKVWDVVVIGGGATGLGVAVDAVTRGYSVALFEWEDFAKATSSRSTKLVHGGVRYLAQGDVSGRFREGQRRVRCVFLAYCGKIQRTLWLELPQVILRRLYRALVKWQLPESKLFPVP